MLPRSPPSPDPRLMRRAVQGWPYEFLPVMEEIVARHGDVVRIAFGVPVRYVCSHPDAVKQVLVDERDNFVKAGPDNEVIRSIIGSGLLTSDGPRWKRLRTSAIPQFRPAQLQLYSEVVAEECEALADRWERRARTGDSIDVCPEMLRFAISVLGRALFGVELGHHVHELVGAFRTINSEASRDPTVPVLPFLWGQGRARYRAALRTIDRICAEIADESAGSSGTLLAALCDGPVNASTARDHVKNFLFAGHATTASVLSFLTYVLGSEPDVARRATAEVDTVLGARPVRFDDLKELDELRRICQETLRCYSPVWHMPYQSRRATVIGGYRIPARAIVSISPYLMHRRADLWPDPLRFDPDRFLRERVRERSPYVYIPFGMGARRCIGERLSTIEITMMLAVLSRRFVVELLDDEPVRCMPILTFRPDDRLRVRVRPRSTADGRT
uniref:GphK n=2 Tax=Archangium violaceum TaxID=83451 RepID=U6BSB7_9BACT|nr:GphK [Archangium violaceum Cb vi76]